MWPENIFTRCIYLLAFMEIAFFHYRFHHILGIQDKHLRVDAEGHCHICVERCNWDDGRGWLYTRHVPAEGEDPLAGINDLCAHHGVSTHYYCSGSLRVSRNILGAGGHILWLGGR